MKTYQVTITYQVTLRNDPNHPINRTMVRNITATDIDNLAVRIEDLYPSYRVIGPNAIRRIH